MQRHPSKSHRSRTRGADHNKEAGGPTATSTATSGAAPCRRPPTVRRTRSCGRLQSSIMRLQLYSCTTPRTGVCCMQIQKIIPIKQVRTCCVSVMHRKIVEDRQGPARRRSSRAVAAMAAPYMYPRALLLLPLLASTASSTLCRSADNLASLCGAGLTFFQFIDYTAIYGTGGTLCYR